MAQDFFGLLYTGYTGEYQLMSSLYRNGLDALRPLVSNLTEILAQIN